MAATYMYWILEWWFNPSNAKFVGNNSPVLSDHILDNCSMHINRSYQKITKFRQSQGLTEETLDEAEDNDLLLCPNSFLQPYDRTTNFCSRKSFQSNYRVISRRNRWHGMMWETGWRRQFSTLHDQSFLIRWTCAVFHHSGSSWIFVPQWCY